MFMEVYFVFNSVLDLVDGKGNEGVKGIKGRVDVTRVFKLVCFMDF